MHNLTATFMPAILGPDIYYNKYDMQKNHQNGIIKTKCTSVRKSCAFSQKKAIFFVGVV